MTGNLAQITRTWVAATLVTGIVNIPSLTAPTDANLSNHSIPGYLFTWLPQTGSSQSIGQPSSQPLHNPLYHPGDQSSQYASNPGEAITALPT
jgi:hypothetical protein